MLREPALREASIAESEVGIGFDNVFTIPYEFGRLRCLRVSTPFLLEEHRQADGEHAAAVGECGEPADQPRWRAG